MTTIDPSNNLFDEDAAIERVRDRVVGRGRAFWLLAVIVSMLGIGLCLAVGCHGFISVTRPYQLPVVSPQKPACSSDPGFEADICQTGAFGGLACRVCEKASACFDLHEGVYCVDKSGPGGAGCFDCSNELMKRGDGGVQ